MFNAYIFLTYFPKKWKYAIIIVIAEPSKDSSFWIIIVPFPSFMFLVKYSRKSLRNAFVSFLLIISSYPLSSSIQGKVFSSKNLSFTSTTSIPYFLPRKRHLIKSGMWESLRNFSNSAAVDILLKSYFHISLRELSE